MKNIINISININIHANSIRWNSTQSNHSLRLAMRKIIQKISILKIPNYENTLKNNENEIFINANDTLRTMLILLTRRLERMCSLSYITLMNPHMAKIWNAYLNSYGELLTFIGSRQGNENLKIDYSNIINYKIINNIDNLDFVKVLQNIIDMHTDNIVDLRDGIKENKEMIFKNSSSNGVFSTCGVSSEKKFLDDHLRERILLRLVANNHILLSNKKGNKMLEKNLNVLEILQRCMNFVNDLTNLKYCEKMNILIKTVEINSNGETLIDDNINSDNISEKKLFFPYIGNHIEYVLNEVLKNSARATIENKVNKPVNILVVLNNSKPKPILQVKISDSGNGIHPDIISKLWEYSFTTVKNNNKNINNSNSNSNLSSILQSSSGTDVQLDAARDLGLDSLQQADTLVNDNIIAGMGYGLPLSSTYCRLFGGDIKLNTVYGKGTDVYVIFKGI
jgi:signal transduction histidine kinase